jgi:uncharacterized protein YbjT (DUF2867 family)
MDALIFGATGMVGTEVLHQCLDSDQIDKVVTIGRHATGVVHPELVEIEHQNFLDFSSIETELTQTDICFYCLGDYQNQVAADVFWQITVGYLEALIYALEKANKELTFCLFSAQGADQTEKSPFRFAKAKGRAEKILLESGVPQKYIFRPGYIKPGRISAQAGWTEWAAGQAYRVMPGIGIDAADLSKVMVNIGLNGHEQPVLSNREMRNLAQKFN